MKKIYLLIVMLLSIFSYGNNFNSFASKIKIDNLINRNFPNIVIQQIKVNSESNYKVALSLASPTTNPTVSSTSICVGDNLILTANPSGGVAPYTFSWSGPNGFTSTDENPVINNVSSSNAGTYSLIITDALSATSIIQSTAAVVVNDKIDPSFDATLPVICEGGIPPLLTATSTNGITGTWNPAIVSNIATASYLFTPTAGQCANTLLFTVFVIKNVIPKFTLPTSICDGATTPILLTTSNNGIIGTWNPATLSNTASGSYTFTPTPTSGQCATSTTISITVNPIVTPIFAFKTSICNNETPPILPNISSNGITGTWSPSIVSNTVTGNYTFTPTASQCAPTSTNITVTVNPNIIPTFDPISPICSGTTSPVLPTTSNNGYSGTWSPALVSNTNTDTYTFTPTAGLCATTASLTVTVNPNIVPTFDPIAPICSGAASPILPATSNNGYTGTWSPASVNNATTGTYTFTPSAGLCATTTSLTVTVNPKTVPTFTPIAAICSGATSPVLPTTSNNGYSGTWSPALVSNTATGSYTFTPDAGLCATTALLTVTVTPNLVPTFDPIAPICAGSTSPALPATSNNGYTGTWSPALVDNTASGTYIFTPTAGLCATSASLTVTVNPNIVPSFDPIAPICSGATSPILPATSNNGYTGTWSPALIDNTASGTYTFTPTAGLCATTTSLTVTVTPNLIPIFDPIAPICSGTTSPVLSATSNNGYTGTWNPALVSNTATGTYTFTPTAGLCATTASLTVTVNPKIIPTFTPIAPICSGATSPILPTISNNGYSGTWTPALVSNTTTGIYTFTPDSGLCATTTSLTVTITPNIVPTFDPFAPICSGATSPILPATSNNGYSGTWSPSLVDNTATGTYTFTPSAALCLTSASLTVTVNPNIVPTFDPIAPICSGAVSPILPATSNNGYTGTWSPALVDNAATGTYTFTPAAGLCATSASLTVTVNPNIVPTFDPIAPICSGATSPVLSATSNNGYTGTWNPALVSNTATGTYTFTPTAGLCATTASLTVTVNPKIIPTFTPIAPICSGATSPILPTISNNGYSGTWTPALVSNTTTGSYNFTPDSGLCATTTSLTVTITPNIVPTFDPIAPICAGATSPILPATSNNGYSGTWSPSLVDNTATGTYTFTPTAGLCATIASVTVTVNPNIVPTFDPIAPICSGATSPILPATSNNGYTGTWSPALIDNTASGTYTFTPTAGLCATTTSLTVTVTPNLIPIFDPIAPICSGATSPILPITSNNGYTGTWSPATVDNTVTGTYTFTPTAGLCATTASLTVNVTPNIVPIFTSIAPICYGLAAPILPSTSNDGYTGTWNPPTISNTVSGTYVFTPNPAPGQCLTTASLSVTVTINTPIFTAIAPICSGATAPILQTTSNNGITGSWSPALVDNTTTGTYIFIPDAGQCAPSIGLIVTVNPYVIPVFTAISPICFGGTSPILVTTSNDGYTGTWSPSTVDNTATGTYIFTPSAGQCATTTALTILVNPNIVPTFTPIAPICSGSTSPLLSPTSNNGITGTWNPATISNTATGTYIFTPTAGLCATTSSLTVTVNQSPTDIVFKTTDVVNDKPDGIIEISSVTNGSSPFQYSINNSSFTTNTVYSDLLPGTYSVTVKDSNGCTFNKVTTVVSVCMFPNAISPNGDGLNDSLNLNGCDVVKLELFNRWGRKINSYSNYSNQWDGTNSSGEEVTEGTYFYVADLKGGTTKTGWIFIAR